MIFHFADPYCTRTQRPILFDVQAHRDELIVAAKKAKDELMVISDNVTHMTCSKRDMIFDREDTSPCPCPDIRLIPNNCYVLLKRSSSLVSEKST